MFKATTGKVNMRLRMLQESISIVLGGACLALSILGLTAILWIATGA